MNHPLPNLNCTSSPVNAGVLGRSGGACSLACVEEEAIAFRYNGFAHGVMMATPADIEDFAFGFSLSEGIVDSASDIGELTTTRNADGIAIEISLRGATLHRFLAGRRLRQLRGNTSCGLCGVSDFDDVRRPAARVQAAGSLNETAILAALERLRELQPLSRLTRGAHAAAWVSSDGSICAVREDVGRHNALDKLIGAGLRGRFVDTDGFCLVTSRCSFEMVQKAIAAGFPAIVSASAPTALAIRTAQAGGLTLCALSRDGVPLIFAQPDLSQDLPWQRNAS